MIITIIASPAEKEELLKQGFTPGNDLNWISDINEIKNHLSSGAFIILSPDNSLSQLSSFAFSIETPVIINSVIETLNGYPSNFVRLNAWPGFLQRPIAEMAASNVEIKSKATEVMRYFNKQPEWVDDITGMISARVIAMIINEAYFALQEEISTKADMDIAMKLGTNYPFGPFEWAENIGLKKINALLQELSKSEKRYLPSPLLIKAALH